MYQYTDTYYILNKQIIKQCIKTIKKELNKIKIENIDKEENPSSMQVDIKIEPTDKEGVSL